MLVYMPTGEMTTLKQGDIISLRQEEDDFLPKARVFRQNMQLIVGIGAERRNEHSVFLTEDKKKWTPDYIRGKLKIDNRELELLDSSNDSVCQFRVIEKDKEGTNGNKE